MTPDKFFEFYGQWLFAISICVVGTIYMIKWIIEEIKRK